MELFPQAECVVVVDIELVAPSCSRLHSPPGSGRQPGAPGNGNRRANEPPTASPSMSSGPANATRCARCVRATPSPAPGVPLRLNTWSSASCVRLDPAEVFRGRRSPVTVRRPRTPRFFEFIDAMRGHPVRFDMVSNGHLLSPDKLAHLDGVVELLIVSFSSVDPRGLPPGTRESRPAPCDAEPAVGAGNSSSTPAWPSA